MDISPWWGKKQRRMVRFIAGNASPLEAVKFAQTPRNCAFDHRRGYKDKVVQFKLNELLKRFPELPDIKESKYSIPGTVGENGYSNMFLTHLYFYLNIMEHSIVPKRILEIGAGYGGLARIFKVLHPEIAYTIIDLPESIYFSKHFLTLNRIEDICFVLPEDMEVLSGEPFDVVVNTFSFQEMPFDTILAYVDFMESGLRVKGFYTCNYYKNKEVSGEQSYDGDLPVDDRWTVLYDNYNAPILTIDSPRSFKELYLERMV